MYPSSLFLIFHTVVIYNLYLVPLIQTFELDNSLLWGGCPVYRTMFSSILDHYPLNGSSTPAVATIKSMSRHHEMAPGKITPD